MDGSQKLAKLLTTALCSDLRECNCLTVHVYALCAGAIISVSAALHSEAATTTSRARAPDRVLLAQRVAPGQIRRTAAIHWQNVPLREAIGRLEKLFDDTVFLDRRVDPTLRVKLDIQAFSVDQVLERIATAHRLGVARIGQLVYLGPQPLAERLAAVAADRVDDVARLVPNERAPLARKRRLVWPRLTEPRSLVKSLIEQHGWRVTGAQRIPHDLWPAGQLPELSLAEQLTVLLVGFDLTFEVQPRTRTFAIVPLDMRSVAHRRDGTRPEPRRTPSPPQPQNTKQVYSLRVAEKPVGAVLQELASRLNWKLDVDREAIAAAGRSLDQHVSFTVENVGQEELLEALLEPAGLAFRRDGERIQIVPREAASN